MARIDVYQTVTDRVIEAMEEGTLPWQRGWKTDGAAMGIPLRHTGDMYRGINVLLLWIESAARGFNSNFWMTFNQAKQYGGCVRKGEKGTKIVYFNIIEKEDRKTGEEKKIPFLKQFTVFNADQIDGLPEKFAVKSEPIDTGTREIGEFESFFAATGAHIETSGNQPCYVPAMDKIKMPKISQFNSADEYYGTLAHEIIHWTGHESRLDRLGNHGKREEYAFEELIAELGNLYLCNLIGATPDFSNSAAYLNSWLAALKNDKKFIFKAATEAQKASDFVMDKAGHTLTSPAPVSAAA